MKAFFGNRLFEAVNFTHFGLLTDMKTFHFTLLASVIPFGGRCHLFHLITPLLGKLLSTGTLIGFCVEKNYDVVIVFV